MRDDLLDDRVVSRIASLTDDPTFQALKERANLRRDEIERRLIGEYLKGAEDAPPVDQRKIDYKRGFLDGVKWIMESPGQMLLEEEVRRGAAQRP